jgi:hypothetical protein
MRVNQRPICCRPALLLLLPVCLSSACAVDAVAPEEEVGSHAAAVVDTDSPWSGPSTPGDMPTLPGLVSGARPLDSAVNATGPQDIHDAVYLNGRDLRSASDRFSPTETAEVDAWLDRIEGDEFSASDAYRLRMQSALEDAATREGTLDEGYLDDAFDAIGSLGGSLEMNDPVTTVSAPRPSRARWMASQWACPPKAYCPWSGEQRYRYEDPQHFEELRERGARQYCAARTAVQRQGSTVASMGEQAATSFRIFGRDIDLLVLEPTVAMSAPERFTGEGENDGAQAFVIPMLMGTKVTPIRGIGLDGLPEVRSPVSLVTGDTEVLTRADQRNVRVRVGGGGMFPTFKTKNIHSKQYKTATHAESFVSTSRSMEWSAPDIPIYRIGPFYVVAKIGLTAEIGKDSAGNDRVLRGAPAGWPTSRPGVPSDLSLVSTFDGNAYYDGAWTLTSFSPGAGPIVANSGTWLDRSFQPWDPFLVRALEDGDHVIDKETNIGLSLALAAGIGFRWSRWGFRVEAGVEVQGGIEGTAGQVHEVRESAHGKLVTSNSTTHLDSAMVPLTGIVVTPSTSADLDFQSKAELFFKVALPVIGEIVDWNYVIYDVDVDLARWESAPWPEANRFRIGTGAPTGDVMKQPNAVSHFPQRGHFTSFPDDIDTCLEDDSPLPDEPPLCEPTSDPDDIPSAELCVYGVLDEGQFPATCSNVDAYLAAVRSRFTPEQVDCIADSLKFLCQPVSMEQWWHGRRVVSRVIEHDDDGFMAGMTTMMDQCGVAFGGTADAVRSRFSVGVCDDGARLLEGDDVIDTSGAGGEPAREDGSCE